MKSNLQRFVIPDDPSQRDGTFDCKTTRNREVWIDGVVVLRINEAIFNHLTCSFSGKNVELIPFGSFPDRNEGQHTQGERE